MRITAHRYHDFSYGHRVVGHEGKCKCLHGHNGRVTFHCDSIDGLDALGRVVDFSVIKRQLCQWLEDNWDHRMLIFSEDPLLASLKEIDPTIVEVDFNPTAENMAIHLLNTVGPKLLEGMGLELTKVTFMETAKCGATVVKD